MDMDNHLQHTGVYLDHNHHHLYNADGEKGHIEKLHFQFYNFSKDRTLLNFHRPFLFVKLREREGQRVDLGRSLKGHLWMVDGGWWYTFP